MPVYILRCELRTASNIADTFRVFEDPYNLARITPPSLGFEVTNKERVVMAKNAEITYCIRWLGLPMHWKTIIRDYQPPSIFVDEQAKGPYTFWHHTHTFWETEQGTLIRDHVEYSLPLGPLGQIAHSVLVRRQLLAIFAYRQQELAKLLRAATTQTLRPVIEAKTAKASLSFLI